MKVNSSVNPGGKASVLIELEKNNFPVPNGYSILNEPNSQDEWESLFAWWKSIGQTKLAVRSSAQGEDGAENSFAGQFLTLLQISSESELRAAVKSCFRAVDQQNSIDYTKHFSQNKVQMRVYVQRMIQSQFSGVFFSKDPRGLESHWLVEAVKGQGEQLVSGQVTPVRFSESQMSVQKKSEQFNLWSPQYLNDVVNWGKKVESHLGYDVDMEWAIDPEGRFWILQARPITTFAGMTQKRRWIAEETERIEKSYDQDAAWDGQVFSEWTGLPTEMTFDLWRRAFSKGYAFDLSLRKIGYKGIDNDDNKSEVLLERIFGRCYLNLNKLLPIYFGTAPYRIELKPRPHLKFDISRLNLKNIFNAPAGWMRMINVAWNLQTGRRDLAKESLRQIESYDFAKRSPFDLFHQIESLNLEETKDLLVRNSDLFTKEVLQHTFLLTLLIESTYQGILALLRKDYGDKAANEIGQLALGQGLMTVTLEMQTEMTLTKNSQALWKRFQSLYGHRGAGELDLANPRWIEIENPNKNSNTTIATPSSSENMELNKAINKLGAIRRQTLREEIQQLHMLLQTREKIKMHTMKIYAEIRWLLLRVAAHLSLSPSILFWLNLDELLLLADNKLALNEIDVNTRKEKIKSCLSVDLPQSFSFSEMKKILNGEVNNDESVLHGSNLSTGICQGKVHIVIDPENENLDMWAEDIILVAEATDPSWTALFAKSKGIIVSRGGVLSHCAIVAREMGRPAVGEIAGATHLFREGEHVWVDGTHGIVRRNS